MYVSIGYRHPYYWLHCHLRWRKGYTIIANFLKHFNVNQKSDYFNSYWDESVSSTREYNCPTSRQHARIEVITCGKACKGSGLLA